MEPLSSSPQTFPIALAGLAWLGCGSFGAEAGDPSTKADAGAKPSNAVTTGTPPIDAGPDATVEVVDQGPQGCGEAK